MSACGDDLCEVLVGEISGGPDHTCLHREIKNHSASGPAPVILMAPAALGAAIPVARQRSEGNIAMSEAVAYAARCTSRGPSSVAAWAAAILGASLITGCGGDSTPPPPSPGIYLSKTSVVTAEGGANVAVDVRLATQPAAPVDVFLWSSDSTEGQILEPGALAAYAYVALTFTPANWGAVQTVQVVPVDDLVQDGNVTYSIGVGVDATADPVYAAVPDRVISVTNSDDDVAGFTLSKTTASTSEASTTDSFTVRLNMQPTATVTIPVTLADTTEGLLRGGNSPSTSQPSITLTFTTSNWSVPQPVTIFGQNDQIDDGNQTYTVAVGPTTGSAEYAALAGKTVSVTNLDDDAAGITVAAASSPLVTSENGTTSTFTVRLNTEPLTNVVVAVTSGNLAEGLLSSGAENLVDVAHLIFSPTSWSTPQIVIVSGQDEVTTQILGDNLAYDVTVGPATGDAAYVGLPTQAVHVLNTDNDAAGIIVPAAGGTALQTQETGAGNTVTFTVAINKLPAGNVVIPVTVSDVTEGLVQGGSAPTVPVTTLNLTFTPADFQTAQTVTVIGQVDNVVDGNQAYTIAVGPASGDAAYASLAAQTVPVVNADSDVAGFTVSKAALTVTEGGVVNTFTVVLNRAPVADVVVPVSSGNPAEGLLAGGSSGGTFVTTLNLTFTLVNWSTAQTVQVRGVIDSIDDGDQTYTITVGPTASGSSSYNGLAGKTIAATTTDADTAGFTVTPTSGLVTTEAGGTTTFTVRPDTIPTGTVTIPVSPGDTSEALVSAGGTPTNFLYLYFTASDWSTPKTVTVHGVDDVVADGTVAYTVSVGPTTSGDPKYSALAAMSVAGVNKDDDATNQGSAVTPVSVTGLLPYPSQVGSGSSYYRLDGVAAGTSALRLSSVAGDVSLFVYSNANFSTGLLCQSTNAGASAGEACNYTVPASGTVYILVTAVSGTTGALFTIDQGPPPPTPEVERNNTRLTAQGPYSGDLVLSGSITAGDYDYFALTNAGAASATVVMRTYIGSVGACSGSGDTTLTLYDSSDSQLAYNDDYLNLCSYLSYSIPAGTTYYLRVAALSSSGTVPSYLLDLNFP